MTLVCSENLTQTATTYRGASGAGTTITLTGNFDLQNGTFAQSTHPFTIHVTANSHNFNQAGGTFNGLLVLDNALDEVVLTSNFTFSTNATLTLTNGTFDISTFNLLMNGTYTQSNGTFDGITGTVDFNNTVNISGGTFDAPSGIMTISFTFTISGIGSTTTFNHNSGTVTFDGTSTINIDTLDAVYNDVNFTGSSGTKTFLNNFSVVGDLTQTGTTYRGAGGGTSIFLTGNFDLQNGTFSQSSNPFTLHVTANSHNFNQVSGNFNALLVLDNASDQVILTSNFSITSNGSLTLTNGTFDISTFALTMNGTYTQSNGTFDGITGTVDFNNTVNISGGVFDAPSGTMTNSFTLNCNRYWHYNYFQSQQWNRYF